MLKKLINILPGFVIVIGAVAAAGILSSMIFGDHHINRSDITSSIAIGFLSSIVWAVVWLNYPQKAK